MNNMTTKKHLSYSPDPVSQLICTRSLDLKSALKGRRFCDATDIIKNATTELKMPSRNGFQKYFQQLHSCWQHYDVAQEDLV
jgi:hypothetical protein